MSCTLHTYSSCLFLVLYRVSIESRLGDLSSSNIILADVSVVCLCFAVDSGSAALYTKQENELFIMNCDIDGMSTYSLKY